MIENKEYNGIIADPRPVEEQLKDWKKVEVVSGAAPVKWIAKAQPTGLVFDLNETTWRKFPVRDQDGSSTCVMQTSAKILGINNYLEEGQFVELSASFGYSFRVNKTWGNGEGMTKPDVGNILNNKGLTLEVLAPSQKMSEVDVNKYVPKESHKQVALVYKTKNDIDLDVNGTYDIEKIASAISTGKGVMLWFKATRAEWNQDCPTLSGATVFDVSHSVTGVDYILWKGEKAIVIEDSWGEFFGLNGQRIITESFLKVRCFLAKEFVDIDNDWRDHEGFTKPELAQKPKHVFLKDLEFSPVYKVDDEVKALQGILRYEGFFPTQIDGQPVELTGYYGAITARAVLQFQQKHNVADPVTLQSLLGRRVGPKTREVLNEIYG